MIIGTCSICGDPVSVPDMWMGVYPPPTCDKCGAVKNEYGPIIDMSPAPRYKTVTSNSYEFNSNRESQAEYFGNSKKK